jgi:flagellar motor switch protein FliN/FliY
MAKKNEAAIVEPTDMEKSALGEICDLISSSLAKAFSVKLGSDVGMSPSDVNAVVFKQLDKALTAPVLLAQMNCVQGLEGQFFLYITGEGLPDVFDLAVPDDAKKISVDDDIILEEVSAIISDAVSEAMTNFAISMGHSIECSVTDVVVIQNISELESIGSFYPEGNLLMSSTVLGIKESEVNIGYLLPLSLSNKLIELLLNEGDPSTVQAEAQGDMEESQIGSQVSGQGDIEQNYVNETPIIQELSQTGNVQPASFGALSGGMPSNVETSNISLLFDVMLDASIELGKTQMTIEEILRLAKGSVIELDKLASEPVEFLVNGKIIARGEVVVIDDNFGIRITEILSQRARLETI